MTFTPPVVSRWYRYDWQYAVDICSFSLLKEAALLISLTPVIISISASIFPSLRAVDTIPIPLWLFWGASVAFVLAWAVVYFRCPKFIREYRDFGQYSLRKHSHRWIVWEFYNNLESLSGWQNIVRETGSKGLSTDLKQLSPSIVKQLGSEFAALPTMELKVFKPININRDIFLPIHVDGQKLVLPMEESDPLLEQKEKELFWILYTQAAKERQFSRIVFWILIGIAALLVSINVVRKIYLVVIDVLQ